MPALSVDALLVPLLSAPALLAWPTMPPPRIALASSPPALPALLDSMLIRPPGSVSLASLPPAALPATVALALIGQAQLARLAITTARCVLRSQLVERVRLELTSMLSRSA
jgi:hypothetical protein